LKSSRNGVPEKSNDSLSYSLERSEKCIPSTVGEKDKVGGLTLTGK
jgi:hypothetical protein